MKKALWIAGLGFLLFQSPLLAQPGAGHLDPVFRSRPGGSTGRAFGSYGVPYVGMPVYDPLQGRFGYASYPVFWWLDPFYQSGYYTWLTGYPPPITAGNLFPTMPYMMPIVPNQPIYVNPPAQVKNIEKPPAIKNDKADGANEPRARDEFDKKESMAREIRLGNAAFASGAFSQALRHYEQASKENPLDGQPWFYQGQALFALGQYPKAVTAIQRGLKWHPQWPAAAFQPRALYGEKGKQFQQHLGQLAAAIEKSPNDDGLLFLLGYQLWFDGEKEKAQMVFRRAASFTADPSAMSGFLMPKEEK